MDVRKQLIKLLYKPFLQYKIDKLSDTGDIADYLIANGVTVQEWIPVTERLPEYNDDGLADAALVTDGFVQHMAYFVGGEWRFAESGEIKEPMWYRITHWMPLPLEPEVKND